MTEQQHAYPSEGEPVAASAPPQITGTAEPSTSGRARRWLAGAMLVTVGLVAGSGATYAFTSSPTNGTPGTTAGYGRGGFGGGPRGGLPPGGLDQGEGSPPDQLQGQTEPGTAGTSMDTQST